MKRGISPLISTVSLIILVIALVAFVINFSMRSIEKGFEKTEEVLLGYENCAEAKFVIEDAFCGDPDDEKFDNIGLIYVKMRNEKHINFRDAFAVRFFYSAEESEDVSSTLDNTVLKAYEIKPIGISRPSEMSDFGKRFKDVKSIEIIPRVKAGDEFKFCNVQKKKIEVRNC